MARIKLLLLTYDAEAAAQAAGMVCPCAGPVPHPSKEPVGHIFHYKMLLQQGVIGKMKAFNKLNVSAAAVGPAGSWQPLPLKSIANMA